MNHDKDGRYAPMRLSIASLLVLLCGCSSNPWTYNTPPGHGAMGEEALQKPIILLDQFTLGTGVDSKWKGIAPQMQQAFTRALLKTGKFEVVTDASLAREARKAINEHGASRARSLATLRNVLDTNAAFLVQARITDFLHTSEAPESVRRLRWFTEANDALVAMDMTAVDLQVGQVVFSDQIVATISAGDEDTDQYGSLEFGSYLFWSTPLGRASTDMLDEAVERLAGLRGATPGGVTITVYQAGSRQVQLSGADLLEDGAIYYVSNVDGMTGKYTSVDDDLGRPLRLRVEKGFFSGSIGWLLSEPAAYEIVTGATLSRTPLVTQLTVE